MAIQLQPIQNKADIHEQISGQSAQVLSLLGIDTEALKKHIRCPLGTHPDNNPSFRVNPALNRYFCSCTRKGASLVDLVIQMGAAADFREAVVFLRTGLGLSMAAGFTSNRQNAPSRSANKVQRSLVTPPSKSMPQADSTDFDQMIGSCTRPGRHGHLARKRIAPIDALLEPNTGRLVLRIHDPSGQTMGLQFISEDGRKRCAEGSKLTGNGLVLGDLRTSDMLAVTEGWATGATIYTLLNIPVLVTFGAANMPAALERFIRPNQRAIIFADNDPAGHAAAIEARALVGKERCSIVLPKDQGLDFNDLHVRASQLVSKLAVSGNRANE